MTKEERIRVARVVIDLIKADSIIDKREIKIYENLFESNGDRFFKFNEDIVAECQDITFSDAINTLIHLTDNDKQKVLQLFDKITMADGLCNKDEALLMTAIYYCLDKRDAKMVAVEMPGIHLDTAQAIYVETKYDVYENESIKEHYDQIENAMRLAGFDFLYIPQMVNIYKETETELFRKVIKFLAPNKEESQYKRISRKLANLDTAQFCREELCRKLNISEDVFEYPSLLIKVGNSVSRGEMFYDYLVIKLRQDFLEEIKKLVFDFSSILNAEFTYIRNSRNGRNKFFYSGVYKQVIDLCLMDEPERCKLYIDNNMNLWFKGLPGNNAIRELKLPRGHKALYLLILMESMNGGIKYNDITHDSNYENKYKVIYNILKGDDDDRPDITDRKKRSPMISFINRIINQIPGSKDFSIILPESINTRAHIYANPSERVLCEENTEIISWVDSELWRKPMNCGRQIERKFGVNKTVTK